MDFEKLKLIWEEKKKYILIGAALLGAGVLYFQSKQSVDNSSVIKSELRKPAADQPVAEKKSISSKNVTCDISGAVKHGGVYTLKNGARLQDLIEAAGGLEQRAQLKAINRAQLLKDQDQIYVPYQGEKVDLPANNTSNSENKAEPGQGNGEQIHLNSATVADLQKLNGIGQKRAEQIIQFRDQNGGFKQIEDLKKVSGIGDKTFEKFKDQLAL